MKAVAKMKEPSNVRILLLPSPPTFGYPATKNVWDYLQELCRHPFVEIKEKNFSFIFSKGSNASYKTELVQGAVGKIVNDLRLLEIASRQKVDVILLYQRLFDPLSLLIARVFLRKKILFFMGASHYQVFKVNSTSGLCTFFDLWRDLSHNIMLYLFQLLFSNEIILVTKRLYEVEPFLSFFKSRIRVVYDVPSRSFFDEVKPQHNIPKRKNMVCFIGSAHFVKGFHVYINAARLSSSKNDLLFLVIGNYQKSEPTRLNEYVNLKEVEERFKNIQFVGRVPHSELINYLYDAKLLVMPSFSEGLPAIVVEAMACGTPILATPAGAIRDLIKDEQTGLIMQENSAEYVSKRILQLLEENDLLQTISEKSSEFVRMVFSFEKSLEAWRKICAMLEQDKKN